MKIPGLAAVLFFCLRMAAGAAPRVALMDFSTDDNSYLSAQAAGDFSSILQASLVGETNVEWVERAQLDRARQELELSVAELVAGGNAIQRGKWVKADWMVSGQFSLDDKNQRTLFLEVTDLRHADTLASRTVAFAGTAPARFQTDTNQVNHAAAALRQLLAEAQKHERQATGTIRVAALFLADTGSRFRFSRPAFPIEQAFNEALERAAATNERVRLIRFPKAYRSLEESEMVLGGLVDTDQKVWQQTADVYVWGTWTTEPKWAPGKPPEAKGEITLQIWDGAAAPVVLKAQIRDDLQPQQMQAILESMANQVIARARASSTPVDSGALRKSIAQTLVGTYDQMTLEHGHRRELGFDDQEKFLEAAHLLETACFFDPDNARAHALYMSCRWGFWINFNDKVKSQFWSKWRCSQAWGNYVNRFGLKPVEVELPFPYQQRGGISAAYVESLKDALEAFPQWHSEEEVALEDPWRQQGTHTWLVEAESHGFPKEMPPKLAWQWKQEVQSELARREGKVAEFLKTSTPVTERPGTPFAHAPAEATSVTNPIQANARAGKMPIPAPERNSRQIISTPDWLKGIHGNFSMFQLSPPNVLPASVSPALEEIQFPAQFEVQSVFQLDRWRDKLLILAMDERSAPTSENNPDASAELRSECNRLWVLEPGATRPVLYQPEIFSKRVQRFLVRDNRLWIAGQTPGYFDLEKNSFHQYGLGDGLPLQESFGIGFAGGTVFTCGDAFNAFRLDPRSDRWVALPEQTGSRSWSGGEPFILTGNDRWLNFSQKDSSAFIYDLTGNGWQNLSEQGSLQCSATDGSGFWFGGRGGLKFYDPVRKSCKDQPAPGALPGMGNVLMNSGYTGNSTTTKGDLERLEQQIQGAIRKIQVEHAKLRLGRLTDQKPVDPFHLNWRVPGDIKALCIEGDFLWLATEYNVLLLHLPSESIVANYSLPARDWAASMLVDNTSVWIGTAYGNHKLIRLSKEAFTSVPRARWVSLAISPAERERFIKGMNVRDRAVYAFNAGEDEQVVQLLASLNPQKVGLEEMFLLLFSCEASGADRPDQMKACAEHINERWPDSPWARFAQGAVLENEKKHKAKQHEDGLLAKYDLNHDGVLSAAEKTAMEKDSNYLREQKAWQADQLDEQIQEILKQFDRNTDGKLDREELVSLRAKVILFADAPPELLVGRKIVVGPLLSKKFPPVTDLLKQYDNENIGGLDIAALKLLAQQIQK